MKITDYKLPTAAFILATGVLLLGNSGGAANAGNYYSGAPNPDNSLEATCSTCHNSGSYGEPQLAVTFAEPGSDVFTELTEYIPGQTYQVTVAVGHLNEAPEGYGFQAQFLDKAASPAQAGTMATENDATRITANRPGRLYAEHNRINSDSTFTFNWTAPAASTGEVEMYVVGNLVNRAQGTGGDNGSSMPTILKLAEGQVSGTNDLQTLRGRIYPNPVATGSVIFTEVALAESGTYTSRLTDMAGRTVQTTRLELRGGSNRIATTTEGLPVGTYIFSLTGRGKRLVRKVVTR